MAPTVGKAYRVGRKDDRAGVCLEVNGELVLVGWDEGVLRMTPVNKRRGFAWEPDVRRLCTEWGVTLGDVDRLMEELVYRHDPDVLKVRSNPLRRA